MLISSSDEELHWSPDIDIVVGSYEDPLLTYMFMLLITCHTSCISEIDRTLVQWASLRFIGGIVDSNKEPETGLRPIGEIVVSDEEPKMWINQ